MRYLNSFVLLFAVVIFTSSGCKQKEKTSAFVEVDGIHFLLNGEPHQFVGTNFWYGAYLGREGDEGNRERLNQELDFLVDHGITNLRVLGASEASAFDNSLKPVFINKDGTYNEELLSDSIICLPKWIKGE